MRLLEGYSTLYISLSVRVSRIGAKLVCLSVTSKQAKVAPECYHGVQGWKWRCPLTASACVLCLDLLSCVWLHISGGRNCCQEIRRGVVYRLIGVEMDIKDINDFNLRTKELGCNYWSTYTKSRIGEVQVTSLHHNPIGVDNRSLGAKN